MVQMDIIQGVFTLNKVPIGGFSDSEDCLGFPDDVEIASVTRGATGEMVGSRTGNKGGAVTIKLLPNSPSVPYFMGLVKAMDAGSPIALNAKWVNPVAGENVDCKNGIITNAPRGTPYGKGAVGERVYVIEFEEIKESPETSLLASAVSAVAQL